MDAYVFDASSLIDLYDENILEKAIDSIRYNDLYISDINFKEINKHQLRTIIKNNIMIFKSDSNEFGKMRESWKNKGIFHSKKDLYVLYVVEKIYKDIVASSGKIYIVTFDSGLINALEKYKRNFNKKNLVIWTTVDLINNLYINENIDYPTFVKKTLRLFKYKEIHKYINSYKKNPNLYNDVGEIADLLKERFQIYKKHLVDNTEQIFKE